MIDIQKLVEDSHPLALAADLQEMLRLCREDPDLDQDSLEEAIGLMGAAILKIEAAFE